MSFFWIFYFSLYYLSYSGSLTNNEDFQRALNEGIKSQEFRMLIVWLASEIKVLGEMEEEVRSDDDVNTFMLELSGFLKELRCPYMSMITGHISERLQCNDSRLKLLNFLLTELMGLKMYNANKPQDTSNIITIVSYTKLKSLIFVLINNFNFFSMKPQLHLR